MSRAINIDATKSEVLSVCARHRAVVTAIETLASGGTRVVLRSADAKAAVEQAFGRKVLAGAVRRTPFSSLGQ